MRRRCSGDVRTTLHPCYPSRDPHPLTPPCCPLSTRLDARSAIVKGNEPVWSEGGGGRLHIRCKRVRTLITTDAEVCVASFPPMEYVRLGEMRSFISPSVRESVRPSAHPAVRQTAQQSLHLSVSPSVCPSVCSSVCPSVRPSVRPQVNPSICPLVRPSVRLFVRPSIRPSARPSLHPFVSPSVHPSVRPSVRPYVRTLAGTRGVVL